MPMRGNIPKKLLVEKWNVLQAGLHSQLPSYKILFFLILAFRFGCGRTFIY